MSRNRLTKFLAIVLVLLVTVALLVPVMALGRAGGGQTSNPGRSSGGGSSSSGMGGALAGAAVGSALNSGRGGSSGGCCNFGGLIFLIIIIYVVMQAINKNKGGTSSPINPLDMASQFGSTAQTAAPISFEALKANDPGFSEQAFYGRVNEMFLAIQKAWEARNMEPARRFLSEQQFQVLAGGVGEYVRNGQINKLDSIHIDRIDPMSVTREGDSDYVKARLTATVIDYTVDERTGEIVNPGVLGDGKTPKTFEEHWTLVRKVGAQSKSDATIQKCPNCGGPVTDGNYVKCAYCGTMMNDPALDWVLLRIEQP